jgi:alpha-L-rhamnosidase
MIESKEITDYIAPVAIFPAEKAAAFAPLLSRRLLALSFGLEGVVCLPGHDYVILDFGKEYAGSLRILTHHVGGQNQGHLRLRFGESFGECNSEVGVKNSTNDHSPRDFAVAMPGLSDLCFGESGFRYVRIDNLDDYPYYAQGIVLAYRHTNAPILGRFISDDATINQIFDVASRTATLCLQNGFLYDGIKRDRLVWSGDLFVEECSLAFLIGDLDAIHNSLTLCREGYPLPSWMNTIPTYSLWWIRNLATLYHHFGDLPYLQENVDYLQALLEQFDRTISPNGELDFAKALPAEMLYFVDWPTYETADAKAGCVSLFRLALRDACELLQALHVDDSLAKAMLTRLKRIPLKSAAARGLRALDNLAWGEKNVEEKDGRGEGLSTFMAYFVCTSLSEQHESEKALSALKEYYGAMLEKGATTFFEDFDLSWAKGRGIEEAPKEGEPSLHGDFGRFCYLGYRLSLCHGWASGPVPYLLESVAGIHFLDAKHVEIRPSLGFLKSVEATVSSAYGPLSVSVKNGEIQVHHPKEITVNVVETRRAK